MLFESLPIITPSVTSLQIDGSTRSSQLVPSIRQIVCSCPGSGRDSTRSPMLTICKSLLPVGDRIWLGRARMS